MEIAIEYCGTCNYRPRAAALAMAIREKLGLDSRLVHSTRSGAFEVSANGEVVFSKAASGVFPSKDEIIEVLKKRSSPA